MGKRRRDFHNQSFSSKEGIEIAIDYLHDPSDLACPKCGPDQIEVVSFLDARSAYEGRIQSISPDDDKAYMVVIRCNGCERSCTLDLSQYYEDCDEEE